MDCIMQDLSLIHIYFRDKKEKVTAIEWEEIDKIPNNKDMLTEAEDAVYLRNLLKELSQDTREVIIPVSYTHLDVYKRQVKHIVWSIY